MPLWSDFFKLFTYATEKDPLSARKDPKNFGTAGISQPEALGTDFQSGGGPGGQTSYRQTNDMIDTTTLSNRSMRYKEYERLRNVPEIEMAMTVFADEACVAGDTPITTPFGVTTIKELAEKRADERFLVYCYDFIKRDYTLGWAFAPRLVKKAKTLTIILDNGTKYTATLDHLVLKKNGEWIETGELQFGDELMPFYRLSAASDLKHKQFPRLFSFAKGWISERQFIDDWKTGKSNPDYEKVNRVIRMVGGGLTTRQIANKLNFDWATIDAWVKKEGFTPKEIRTLYKHEDRRRVVGIEEGPEQDVYDISVEGHKCFATDSVILHNCQKDEDGNIFKVITANDEIREEVEFLLLHRKMLNMNRQGWTWFKNLCISGDWFVEMVINPDNPKEGIYRAMPLPPETMYRIETVKGKMIEYQQSKEGPDYQAIIRGPVTGQNEMELNQTTAIRFAPSQVVHFRIGDDRKTFFPYGQSLIEPARGPAHSLRLMEDAMVVYRLCLVGDSRVRTEDSYKLIRNLKVGDCVWSLTPKGIIPAKVSWFVNNGIQDILKVRTKHVELRGTKTHPVLVNRTGVVQYVDMQDLQIGKDRLLLVDNDANQQVEIPFFESEPWAKLSKEQLFTFRKKQYKNKSNLLRECHNFGRAKQFLYCKNKALPLSKAEKICEVFGLDSSKLIQVNKNQRNEERISLPYIVDEEFARLFGFLCGDGNIHNGSQLSFSAGTDKTINEVYRAKLENYFGKVRFETDKRSLTGCGKHVVDSTFACSLMTRMGYINNHDCNRIPKWVFTAPKNIRRAFIEGLSDADGCERHTNKGTWFSTIELCNEELVRDIKELWSSIGLSSGHLKTRHRKGGHEIEIGRVMPPTTSYSVTISDVLLPEEENIISIEEDGKEEVFDITVDNEYHNFIVNGCCTHNTRAPERRVFYIDVGQLPPFKAEAFIDRLKDQFRKRKITSGRGAPGANSVEERWQPPAQDEDYWLPIRPNSLTRIDTLPGAENLGEIDDAVYFRNKLLTSLNFPKNYFNNEDPGATRITLSTQDVKFARMIERLQSHFEDGILDMAERHLHLRGYPEESYQDLKIKMTAPSDWRELSRAEVVTARYTNAGTLKSGQLMADYDIVTKILKFSDDEADEMLARLKLQKLEDLKLQVLAQNPQLLGVGIPGADAGGGQGELGTEPGGPGMSPDPMAGGDPMAAAGGGAGAPPPTATASGADETPDADPGSKAPEGANIPEPDGEDIKKYDLEIQDYEAEQDREDIDYSVGDEG